MNKHVLDLLPAYHDGELSPERQRHVEEHLQDCAVCRAELQTLTDLSALLKSDPLPQRGSPERFVAQVQLLLPRSVPQRSKTDRLPLWVLGIPLVLVVIWAFLQAAVWVASLALAAGEIFPAFAPWLASGSDPDVPSMLPVLYLVLLTVATVLWSAWLAFWQAWIKHKNSQAVFNTFGKEV